MTVALALHAAPSVTAGVGRHPAPRVAGSDCRRSFPARAEAIRQARRYVLGQLADLDLDAAQTNVAELLVSELATNALCHTHSDFEISVQRNEGRVRVGVLDAGAGTPTVRSLDPQSVRGRGLAIVRELAEDWGVEPAGDGAARPGKTVWFELAASARTEHGVLSQGPRADHDRRSSAPAPQR